MGAARAAIALIAVTRPPLSRSPGCAPATRSGVGRIEIRLPADPEDLPRLYW